MLKTKRLKLYKSLREDLWGYLSISEQQRDTYCLIYLSLYFSHIYKYKKMLFKKRLLEKKKRFLYVAAPDEVPFKKKYLNFRSLNRFTFLKFKKFYGNLKKKYILKSFHIINKKVKLYGSTIHYLLESLASLSFHFDLHRHT